MDAIVCPLLEEERVARHCDAHETNPRAPSLTNPRCLPDYAPHPRRRRVHDHRTVGTPDFVRHRAASPDLVVVRARADEERRGR